MTPKEKLTIVQNSDEMQKAVSLLRSCFEDCDLKSNISYGFTFKDGKTFQLIFMPVAELWHYENGEPLESIIKP